MKKSIVLFACIAILVVTYLTAQKTYIPIEKRWNTVEELANKQLPESALKEVESILEQARKEKNTVQLIKATLYKMRFTLEKDPDQAPALIKKFEALTTKSTDPAESALLHSMSAELYLLFYQRDAWTINNRTELTGLTPDDMKEWTKNIYFKKIKEHLNASLANPSLLQKTDVLKFAALLQKGADSKTLQPTLFDFLANRKIQLLDNFISNSNATNTLDNPLYLGDVDKFISAPADTSSLKTASNEVLKTYQQLLAFRLKANNIPALINLDLERLEHFHSNWDSDESDSLYITALNRLATKFSTNEAVIEVMAEQASYYYSKAEDAENETLEENQFNLKRRAYDICINGIKRFPSYKRIGLLHNIQAEITKKTFSIEYKNITSKKIGLNISIKASNTSAAILSVYKVNMSALAYQKLRLKENDRKQTINRTLLESKTIAIKTDPNFAAATTDLTLKPYDYGIYEFELKVPNVQKSSNTMKGWFVVSDLTLLKRQGDENNAAIYILNRQTGHCIPNAKVKVFNQAWNGEKYLIDSVTSLTTNKVGYLEYKLKDRYKNDLYFLSDRADAFFSSDVRTYYNSLWDYENKDVKIDLFTDRSLYRPSQTVYFKGIAYYSNKLKQEVNANAEFEVKLYDANRKEISSKKLKSNEFGSFNGSFILPSTGLNGAFYIQTGQFSEQFWVEEYKRPTFEVKMETPKEEIQFGDKVKMLGTVKAYAGYNIGNANVKYRVVKRVHHFCWWWNEPEEEVTNGALKSNADGTFEVIFTATKKNTKQSNAVDRAYSYTVYADVTDPKGETQQGEQDFSVGDKSLFIIADIPEMINKQLMHTFNVSTETLNGEKINSTVKYKILSIKESAVYAEDFDAKKDAKIATEVLSGSYQSQQKQLELKLDKLKSGRYKIILSTTDAHNKEVKTEKIFILFSTQDSTPAVKSYVWFQTPKTICAIDENAMIQFGTSTQNTQVLYEIMQGNIVLESRWITLTNEIQTFNIPFKESYGPGVNVQFTFIKDEQLFTRTVQLQRKKTERQLTPTFSVFRNKLLPGEKAEWTVSIPETKTKTAELLVGMYDSSLDAIREHNWYFSPEFVERILTSPFWKKENNGTTVDNLPDYYKIVDAPTLSFSSLNWFGFQINRYANYPNSLRKSNKFSANLRGNASIVTVTGGDDENGLDIRDVSEIKSQDEINTAKGVISISNLKGKIEFEGMSVAKVDDALQGKISGLDIQNGSENMTKPVQIRTNFNETAFFYPQLRTDADGNVKFSFTAPESLTRWNVKMLAHTKDLYFGQFDTTAITQKDLMVQMNLPRFVRRSDKLVLSANVINLTNKEMTANVQFEMINPATDKTIVLKGAAIKSVTLKANETKSVEWELTEFSPYELVTCKVIATAGNFSDGEQKYLPVLPDKILVTESMPLIIRGNQTRTFNFESLQKNASSVDTKNLSVEFSSNPTWYAVQALPTVSVPESDNAMDLFTAYYSNSLATYIANSSPKIAATFDRWKNAGGSREALLSNLEKNTELKNMLLDETPWVMAAQNESEQKRAIALLFDLNNQKNQAQQYWDKLQLLQLPSGGFTWFKGMSESRYITMEIMLNLARLERMTKQSAGNNQQLTVKALGYLDAEIAHDFENLKKYNPDYQKVEYIDNSQLFYLHVRSEYKNIPVAESAREAVKFYTALSEKYWTKLTLYGKAMMAIVAYRNGNSTLASNILKSLKENALKTDEFGMYWANNTSGYFWNERPIAIQAAIIEAFAEVANSTADVDEMKLWLLKQKQTQRWDSPSATLNAIYALLLQGSDWLSAEGSVKIKVGNTTLQPTSTEAGTGYFKQSLSTANVRPEMSKVTVTKNDKNIGWGAMYWQFYQDLAKITGQSGALKVSKKLFVEKISAAGKNLLPIEQTELKKGDKVIIRLVITTDRNLEYVALKDLRASCFEPVDQRSGCEWKEGVCYYQTSKDASTQFFFSYLPKGTYVFEYAVWVNASGEYTSGIATIQCQYAPEFLSHTGGERIKVK